MAKCDQQKNGYKIRYNKYKKDPLRPQPHLRVDPKSRRMHPLDGEFCIRKSRCKNSRRCKACVPLHRLWRPRS